MRVTIAPDSFKGSLSATDVAEAMAAGMQGVWPQCEFMLCPMADGGEGTAEVLLTRGGTRVVTASVDIFGRPSPAFWVRYGRTALVEAAVGSGYQPVERRIADGVATTSLGTGLLIAAALRDPDVDEVFVALGGTGSTDGGMGLLSALGAEFWDAQGTPLPPYGTSLPLVRSVQIQPAGKPLVGLYDVDSKLVGRNGAVRMFGPQKGVPATMLSPLDAAMRRFAECVRHHGRENWAARAGAGAAGGMGFGILAAGGRLRPGAPQVAEWVGLDRAIGQSDWVITGEGKIDAQTARGKVVGLVAERAAARNVPVAALVGGRGAGADLLYKAGLSVIYPILPGPVTLTEALREARQYITDGAMHLAWAIERCWRPRTGPLFPEDEEDTERTGLTGLHDN
ncbi:MAG: glycerate kinase [Thermaerobacter sp.]|nr:glycerate kinase [Thermaerobacter sp.]